MYLTVCCYDNAHGLAGSVLKPTVECSTRLILVATILQVDGLVDQVNDMTIPLNKLQAIVDTDVNITSLRQDLTAIGSFLDNAPTPSTFLADLAAVDGSVQGRVKPTLVSLAVLLSASVSVSPLAALGDAVDTVVGTAGPGGKLGFDGLMTNMTTGSSDYSDALADVAALPG